MSEQQEFQQPLWNPGSTVWQWRQKQDWVKKHVWSLLPFLKIGVKSPVSRFFLALSPEWFQVLNAGWTENLDHYKELLRGVLVGPLHIVVDQLIKNLHNLKIIISGVLLKRINSSCFQFFFTIRSDTWACKLLILTSVRGVSEISLGSSYFRDPLLTYWAVFALIGVFWTSTKESSWLEGNKEKIGSDILNPHWMRVDHPVWRWPTGCASERLRSSGPKVQTGSTRWLPHA